MMKHSRDARLLREAERVNDFSKAMLVCTSKMSLPLYMAFWLADLIYAPHYKWEFLVLRSILIPANLWFNYRFKKPVQDSTQAQRLGVIFAFFNSFPITIMIFMAEGASSPYYAGLNLVSVGILSFFPWTSRYLPLTISAIFLPFYIGSLAISPSKDKMYALIINSFFIVGTTIASLVIRWFSEQSRMNEISARTELKVQNKVLAETLDSLQKTQADLIQSEKLASLGTLSAGIAHEINNAIYSVSGALGPIRKVVATIDDPDKKKEIEVYLEVMGEGADLIVKIVQSLRGYTGLNKAKYDLVVLEKVITSVLILIHSKLESKIDVKFNFEKNLEFYGSAVGFHQVFMNLITNSIDAMPSGGIISIAGKTQDGQVLIHYRDSGTGIPERFIKSIFDPFFTTKQVGKGTGLGLHIVRSEIEKHHGTIVVKSEEAKGTEFFIKLPTQQPMENV